MAIFLSILKVLGLILLWILIVLAVLLCYLLFLPIHYDFAVKNQEEHPLEIKLRACGFIKFWQIAFQKEEEDFEFRVSAFWGKLLLFPRKKKEIQKTEPANEAIESGTNKPLKATTEILDEEDVADILEDRDVLPLPESKPDNHKTSSAPNKGKKKNVGEKAPKKAKKKNKFKSDKFSFGEFHKKWKDEHNKSAVQFIIKKVLWIINKTKPKVLNANAEFSLGDPALTGGATGIISLCPACYGKKTKIYPDFESDDIYFKGWIQIKGIVFFMHFVYLIGSVFFNKDCRNLIKK